MAFMQIPIEMYLEVEDMLPACMYTEQELYDIPKDPEFYAWCQTGYMVKRYKLKVRDLPAEYTNEYKDTGLRVS